VSTDHTNRAAELDEFKLYTLTELESVLGVSHRTLLTYVKQGRLKAVKAGGKWKVTKDQLKAFVMGTPGDTK
jgi:excisionase family DNA binding protein